MGCGHTRVACPRTTRIQPHSIVLLVLHARYRIADDFHRFYSLVVICESFLGENWRVCHCLVALASYVWKRFSPQICGSFSHESFLLYGIAFQKHSVFYCSKELWLCPLQNIWVLLHNKIHTKCFEILFSGLHVLQRPLKYRNKPEMCDKIKHRTRKSKKAVNPSVANGMEDWPLCSVAEVETECPRPQWHTTDGGEGWRLRPPCLPICFLSCTLQLLLRPKSLHQNLCFVFLFYVCI